MEDGFCRPLEGCQQRKGPPKGKGKLLSTKERDLNGGDTTNRRFVASL